jgi:enoyl-CoA hydratase/carnithine racemase
VGWPLLDPVDAAESYRMGLVSRLYEPGELLPAALALAATVAQRPPVAAQAAKANLLAARNMGLAQAIQYEREMQAICLATEDAAEGRAAFAAKRPGRFTGR